MERPSHSFAGCHYLQPLHPVRATVRKGQRQKAQAPTSCGKILWRWISRRVTQACVSNIYVIGVGKIVCQTYFFLLGPV